MKNKTIGIIGGVGPQATQYLYGKITEFAQSKYNAVNNDDFPHVIIESLPIPDFISDRSKVPFALKMLQASVARFSASNTVHILLSEIQKDSNLEFISMIELVSDKCALYGYKKVGLLGTPVLTESELYNKALSSRNIELLTPQKEELHVVEEIIRGVIAGNNQNIDKGKYVALINKLFDQGAEGIILGCTELPLAVDYTVLGKRVINSDEVLAEGIVDYYYQ